jgi:hypothetical protein
MPVSMSASISFSIIHVHVHVPMHMYISIFMLIDIKRYINILMYIFGYIFMNCLFLF